MKLCGISCAGNWFYLRDRDVASAGGAKPELGALGN